MGAGQSSSSRRRPGDEEIDRVLELIRLQNQVIQALTPHVNAQSQPLPPPNTPPPAPIPGAPPSSHDPPGASPMPLPMPPPSTPAPATSPSTSYLRTCAICGKEAYWRNGCCMNPTCTATRLSINCTLKCIAIYVLGFSSLQRRCKISFLKISIDAGEQAEKPKEDEDSNVD